MREPPRGILRGIPWGDPLGVSLGGSPGGIPWENPPNGSPGGGPSWGFPRRTPRRTPRGSPRGPPQDSPGDIPGRGLVLFGGLFWGHCRGSYKMICGGGAAPTYALRFPNLPYMTPKKSQKQTPTKQPHRPRNGVSREVSPGWPPEVVPLEVNWGFPPWVPG